jgi:hypothetical protein
MEHLTPGPHDDAMTSEAPGGPTSLAYRLSLYFPFVLLPSPGSLLTHSLAGIYLDAYKVCVVMCCENTAHCTHVKACSPQT